MCSFLITSILEFVTEWINYYQKFRGPDATNEVILRNIKFVHNLLHITGQKITQPFVSNDEQIICLFNGEIYNYRDFGNYKSDGECLIDVYKNYGESFIKLLDGDFAIVLFDFKKKIFICSSDVFATKPIWYAINSNNFGIASYKSALTRLGFENPQKINANTTLIFSFENNVAKLIDTLTIFNFDLEQKKTTYDDWVIAFDNAVKKRTRNTQYEIFVCLSSGYDSGILCCSLNKNNIPYNTYTVEAIENLEILNDRYKLNKNMCKECTIYKLTKDEFNLEKINITKNCEKCIYTIPLQRKCDMLDDKGAVGMSYIFKNASEKKQRVYLSGQGGDEIYSDYGFNGKKIYKHSQFGGKFPEDLNDIFPWTSFYNGTQSSYLSKEECISGLHGIEGRYPLLDKYVVQEFLWLTAELKNNYYKAPLHYYMETHNYPFEKNEKIGFSADKNLL